MNLLSQSPIIIEMNLYFKINQSIERLLDTGVTNKNVSLRYCSVQDLHQLQINLFK